MEKEKRLVNKVKRLVRNARLPRFLNRYGPKDHPLWQFMLCKVVYSRFCRCWRQTALFMEEFYGIKLHWTSWQRAIAKWPRFVWLALQRASVGTPDCAIAAVDGTGISRSNPSQHYIKRVGGYKMARPTQAVVMIDVKRRKFLSWRFRAKPRGEKCDVPYLIKNSPVLPELVLMDKGFDSQPLHEWLRDQGVYSVAPVKKGCKHGRFRKQMRDYFDYGLYWQRNLVESLIGALKRVYGSHLRARSARSQYAELSARLITYNIYVLKLYDLILSPNIRKI